MGWFRQLKQRLRNRIYGVPDYRPQIIEGMTKLYDTLGDHPIKDRLWVNGGVLLGYVREGGLLRHDTDADLSVWEEDVPDLVSLFPRLEAAGFQRLKDWKNNDGVITEYTLKYRDIKIEFFVMFRAGQSIQWYCYGDKPVQQFVCQTPMHGLERIELCGREWNKPDDHSTYLESLFGDWRTPNAHYRYYRDSKAIVSRTPWKGCKR